jgi:3'(2'), 5'-bisphosphate nucleotidase
MAELNQELLDQIIAIAQDASEKILKVYNTNFSVEHKDDKTPLTEADMAAHDTIVEGLKALTPDTPILSEESAAIPFAERQAWSEYWLVDPLDGTREFIKRNGEFTVNIALIREHYPVLGVIHVPVTGVCYFACQGMGAFKRDEKGETLKITARPAHTDKVIVAGSRSHRDSSLDKFLSNLPDYELMPMGSSLKSCLVAEGAADIYPRLGPTSEWDTAAAQCIVEEAGGRLTDLSLNRFKYNSKDELLNPSFLVFGDDAIDWLSYF